MIYMALFWIVMISSILIYYIPFSNFRKENISGTLLLLSASFLVVAIVTKDPIFSAFGVPAEFEWVVGLFITGFSSWKLYFNPLNERVLNIEKENKVIVTSMQNMAKDMHLIKEKLIH